MWTSEFCGFLIVHAEESPGVRRTTKPKSITLVSFCKDMLLAKDLIELLYITGMQRIEAPTWKEYIAISRIDVLLGISTIEILITNSPVGNGNSSCVPYSYTENTNRCGNTLGTYLNYHKAASATQERHSKAVKEKIKKNVTICNCHLRLHREPLTHA
ncbi:Protein of unknown function, partial [Gryllus bimaculatus]